MYNYYYIYYIKCIDGNGESVELTHLKGIL